MGAPIIEDSGLGDDLNFIPTNPKTLQSKNYENIFVIGDATDLPSSKAGSVAHFQADVLYENTRLLVPIKNIETFDLICIRTSKSPLTTPSFFSTINCKSNVWAVVIPDITRIANNI